MKTPTEKMYMRASNKGLTVKINLWALEKYLEDFNPEMVRLWIKGEVTNAGTRESKKFNDAGELISILGRWNVSKFKELRESADKTTGQNQD